jgi:hypothetical protein
MSPSSGPGLEDGNGDAIRCFPNLASINESRPGFTPRVRFPRGWRPWRWTCAPFGANPNPSQWPNQEVIFGPVPKSMPGDPDSTRLGAVEARPTIPYWSASTPHPVARCAQNCAIQNILESFFPRAANDLDRFFGTIVSFAFTKFRKHSIVIDREQVRAGCAPRVRPRLVVCDDRPTDVRPSVPHLARLSDDENDDPTPSILDCKLAGGRWSQPTQSLVYPWFAIWRSPLGPSQQSPVPDRFSGRVKWLKNLRKVSHFEPHLSHSFLTPFQALPASVPSTEQHR